MGHESTSTPSVPEANKQAVSKQGEAIKQKERLRSLLLTQKREKKARKQASSTQKAPRKSIEKRRLLRKNAASEQLADRWRKNPCCSRLFGRNILQIRPSLWSISQPLRRSVFRHHNGRSPLSCLSFEWEIYTLLLALAGDSMLFGLGTILLPFWQGQPSTNRNGRSLFSCCLGMLITIFLPFVLQFGCCFLAISGHSRFFPAPAVFFLLLLPLPCSPQTWDHCFLDVHLTNKTAFSIGRLVSQVWVLLLFAFCFHSVSLLRRTVSQILCALSCLARCPVGICVCIFGARAASVMRYADVLR